MQNFAKALLDGKSLQVAGDYNIDKHLWDHHIPLSVDDPFAEYDGKVSWAFVFMNFDKERKGVLPAEDLERLLASVGFFVGYDDFCMILDDLAAKNSKEVPF